MRVGQGGAYGGGDRGGVRWSSGPIGGQDQSVDRSKDTSGLASHHGVSVPGGAVNDDGWYTYGSGAMGVAGPLR